MTGSTLVVVKLSQLVLGGIVGLLSRVQVGFRVIGFRVIGFRV